MTTSKPLPFIQHINANGDRVALGQSVLIIESDPGRCQALTTILDFIGCPNVTVNREIFTALDAQPWAVILLGQCEFTQSVVLTYCQSLKKTPSVILMTEADLNDTLDSKAVATVIGRLQYPIRFQPLIQALHEAYSYPKKTEVTALGRLVGSSPALCQLRDLIRQVAASEASVLILGESGTGKEMVAHALHDHSSRAKGPFVPVNCGAIPADLLESELFGHEKGAFTGAINARAGRFELAEGGTLFLDEIGDMPLAMQVKLLRVLQDRCFERVGGTKTFHANLRIIAATHRDLEILITQGQFRSDLYYRLNVVPIEIRPLRERTEDIPLLIEEISARLVSEKRIPTRFTEAAMNCLMHYPWPGNVRELANLVERLSILFPDSFVDVSDLPIKYQGTILTPHQSVSKPVQEITACTIEERMMLTQSMISDPFSSNLFELPAEGLDLKHFLNSLEIHLIRQALDRYDGVVSHAAECLKIRRTTLLEKCRKFGIRS